jgi:ribosomal protein S18 acetylase RimI-like enzyme
VADLAAIEAHLRRAPYLHAYELGDLDPHERPHTTWFASASGGASAGASIDAVLLLYRGLATPTILGLADGDPAALHALITAHAHELPPICYAHLTEGLTAALAPRYRVELLSHNLKMALTGAVGEPGSTGALGEPGAAIHRLTPADADEVVRFYREAYPASYFEPVNLVRGPYLAVRDDRGIAAIAGVHVYSPALRVASLGNIATRPDARGRGHAGRATAALCRLLRAGADVIGLNVRADNAPAIACYRRVGFEVRHRYDEWRLELATR